MTQQDLAQAASVPQPSIARIERGAVLPRSSTLIELLGATGHRLIVEPMGSETIDEDEIEKRLRWTVPWRTRQAIGRTAKNPQATPIRILKRLRRFNVPFVLIGDLAEIAHGSTISFGRIIEVCHGTTDVARERLDQALDDLGTAASPRRLRLVTETAAGDDYDRLIRNAVNLHIDAGILVRVAAVDDLIRARRARGTPADVDAAAVLRAIGEEGVRRADRTGL